jgi:signal transduction histidine kinase
VTHRRALYWSVVAVVAVVAGVETLLDLIGERLREPTAAPGGAVGRLPSPLLLDVLDLPVSFALAFALAGWLSKRLTSPLRTLTRATEQLAAAQFPEPLPVPEGDDDLARLARSFNRMSAALRALLERERTLTRYATHELRTPLSALKLQVERAQRHAAAPSSTLDAMARNVVRMEEVIGALLELARTGERDRTPNALLDVVEEVFAALPPAVRGRVDLMSIPPGVRITDAALVQRALHNLIDNALAHGAVPVQVHVGRDRDTLTLRVRDRGPGVPEGALADLTRPYVRSASGGTGLGLALVAFITQTLGGDLALRNLHPGFEANLRLPIVV